MNTFNSINSGETGHSVRGKLNQVLSEITGGSEGINAIWNRLDSLHQYINAMDGGVGGLVKDTSYDPSSLDPHKNITLIALGPGTFSNLKDAWGRPITIVQTNSFTIFFREAGTDYWQYETTVISPSVGATLSNLFDETADPTQMTKDGKPIHPVTRTDLVFSPDGESLMHTLVDLRSVTMGTVEARAIDSLWKETGIYSIIAEPVTEGSPTTSIGFLIVFHDSLGAYCYQRLIGNYANPNNGFVGDNSSVTWDKSWLRKAPLNSLTSRGDWSSWEAYNGVLQQATGNDTTSAMSQKAVTDELNKKQAKLSRYGESSGQTSMQSPVTSEGYRSSVILKPEQAVLAHYVNDQGNGTGVFATDDAITFYTDMLKGKTPLIIKRDGSDSGTIRLRGKDGATITDDLAQFIKDKQNQLKHYYEGEASARMYYKKDTETGGNISIAHVLNDNQAGIYYAERGADGKVTHEDNIYLTETYGNDDGHIGISSVDNENGVTVRSSRLTVKPSLIAIQNNSGLLQFANDIVEMRSNKSDDGLDSIVRVSKEQAWLMHYLPGLVDYYNPLTKETEQRQSGIGIVIDDNKIAFYSELDGYISPLMITKAGEIFIPNVCNDLAAYIKSLEQRIANLEAQIKGE